MRKRVLSPWSKTVKCALIWKDMTVTELAQILGFNRTTVSNVIHGKAVAPEIAEAISEYLGVTEPYSISVT